LLELQSGIPLIIDLEDMLLRKLEEKQYQLLCEVHQLASRYHWSEERIIALPVRRRALYLSLVGHDE